MAILCISICMCYTCIIVSIFFLHLIRPISYAVYLLSKQLRVVHMLCNMTCYIYLFSYVMISELFERLLLYLLLACSNRFVRQMLLEFDSYNICHTLSLFYLLCLNLYFFPFSYDILLLFPYFRICYKVVYKECNFHF